MNKQTDNNKDNELVEINRSLIQVLDELLAKEGWQASQVLRVSAKKIQALRDEAQALLDGYSGDSVRGPAIQMHPDQEGYIPVYIVLYQAQKGTSLDKWHERVASLPRHYVNLPVYGSEEHVKKMLRARSSRDHYGYVEVLVPESKINKHLAEQTDAEGNPLLALHGDAFKVDYIRWFGDGKNRYAFDVDLGFERID